MLTRPINQSFKNLTRHFHIDWPLFLSIASILILGLFILYSAEQNKVLVERQILRIALATGLMLIIAQIPPRFFQNWATLFYLVALFLLIAILIFGYTTKGAQRWLYFGFTRFQPAELMKLALPIMLAHFLSHRVLPPSFSLFLQSCSLILIPMILIILQPDLGTAILIASSGLFVIFFAGISWRILFSLSGLAVLCAPLFWFLIHDYQRKRILTLFNPERDPLGSGYQIIQSKIAIGSGGLFGKGWLNGTQSQLEFLPERSTDFIFAVLSEEFGFIGILILLALYGILLFRGLMIGSQAKNTFSRILASALTMTLFTYIFVNIGMVSGILPVVGVPLPFVSYGGTALITLMISVGILMSIHSHRDLIRE